MVDTEEAKAKYRRIIKLLRLVTQAAKDFRAEEKKDWSIYQLFTDDDIATLDAAIVVLERPLSYAFQFSSMDEEQRVRVLNSAFKSGLIKLRIRIDGREMTVRRFGGAGSSWMQTEDDDGNFYKISEFVEGDVIGINSNDEGAKKAIVEMFKRDSQGEA